MPLLNDEQLARMRGKPPKTCHCCKREVTENYCRQCDEFFTDGHAPDGPAMVSEFPSNNHRSHRTY